MDKYMLPIDETDAIDMLYRLEVATHDGDWADFAASAPILETRFRAKAPEQQNQPRPRHVWPLGGDTTCRYHRFRQ